MHSHALDLRRPLWEVHLIEGLTGNRFAIYIKVHHALFDGVAGSRLLQQMLSTDPNRSEVSPPWSIQRRSAVSASGSGAEAVVQRVAALGGLAKAAASLARAGLSPSSPDVAVPYRSPDTTLNRRVGQQRRVATQTFDFDRIRSVADRADATVNDVFLCIVGGGLRAYLEELGAGTDDGLVAGTPVSIRIGAGDNANNAFTITTMGLRTDLADPLERLRAIGRSAAHAKKSLEGLSKGAAENYGSMSVAPYLAAQVLGLGGRVPPPYNLVASNVPGPLEPQYLAGARLESMLPIGLLTHGQALMVAALTISGTMGIGFVGDRDALPHLQHLAVQTGEALVELERAVAPLAAPRNTRRRPKSSVAAAFSAASAGVTRLWAAAPPGVRARVFTLLSCYEHTAILS